MIIICWHTYYFAILIWLTKDEISVISDTGQPGISGCPQELLLSTG